MCGLICTLGKRYALPLLGIAAVMFMLGYLSQVEKASGGALLPLPFSSWLFINAKLAGVLAMFGSVILLLFMPWLDWHPVRSARFRPLFKWATLILAVDFVILGYVGMVAADATLFGVIPLLWVGQLGTGYYFAYFLAILPWLSRNEKALPLPVSINEAVLKA